MYFNLLLPFEWSEEAVPAPQRLAILPYPPSPSVNTGPSTKMVVFEIILHQICYILTFGKLHTSKGGGAAAIQPEGIFDKCINKPGLLPITR